MRLPCKRHAGRNICGWLGIVAGPAVFVAAQPVPLDDPALVVALGLAVRGGRMIPATCLLADTDTLG